MTDAMVDADRLRDQLEEARRDIDRLRAEGERLRASEAFRIGHALTRAANAPRAFIRSGRRTRAVTPAPKARPPAAPPAAAPPSFPALPVPPGPDWFGPLNDDHATTLVVAWSLPPHVLREVVDDLALLQQMQRHFKPLFVTDSDDAAAFRRYGYLFEHIPPREEWIADRPPHEWRPFVDGRMASILATYRPTRTLVYEDPVRRDALRSGVLDRVVGSSAAIGYGERRR